MNTPEDQADFRQMRPIMACIGISIWKQRRLGQMLTALSGRPRFFNQAGAAVRAAGRKNGAVAVWATREPADLAALANAAGVPVVRIEDGFIRSVGLGADFTPAVSIVCDWRGIYYDPRTPSDLEAVLLDTAFPPELLDRAERLRQTVVTKGVTKYNTGSGALAPPPKAKRRIFVPGQVEDDQSVSTGGAGIKRNLDLLKAVRSANPDAYVIYKPHPDVDAGHRTGAVPDQEILTYADVIARGVATPAIFEIVDEVHTITSLCGFEALLRGLDVTTYGRPFYAGWGLTSDHEAIMRRTRKLSLVELIAGVLILYPHYFDPVTGRLCEVEMVIQRLSQPDLWRPSLLTQARRVLGAAVGRIQGGSKLG